MKISFAKKFAKQYEKSPLVIRKNFDQKVKLFQKDPFSSGLNNHLLTGKLSGYRSINITGDWRAVYSKQKDGSIIFELIGTHSQLYG